MPATFEARGNSQGNGPWAAAAAQVETERALAELQCKAAPTDADRASHGGSEQRAYSAASQAVPASVGQGDSLLAPLVPALAPPAAAAEAVAAPAIQHQSESTAAEEAQQLPGRGAHQSVQQSLPPTERIGSAAADALAQTEVQGTSAAPHAAAVATTLVLPPWSVPADVAAAVPPLGVL